MSNETALFIIPVFSKDQGSEQLVYLDQAVNSIKAQTDNDWHIAIVDDASHSPALTSYLSRLKETHPTRLTLLQNPVNSGPGVARNQAIGLARTRGYPYILFNDADDLSHPNRLREVRRCFVADDSISVIYSSFIVIDEQSRVVEPSMIPPSINEILMASHRNPVEGEQAWIKILTEKKGYVNLTSATSVRTSLAERCLFPAEFVSEDAVTWLKYSALGGKFLFNKTIPSRYRIQLVEQQRQTEQRHRGKAQFFQEVVRVNRQGILDCIRISLSNNSINYDQAQKIYTHYAKNMKKVLEDEQLPTLADTVNSLHSMSDILSDWQPIKC